MTDEPADGNLLQRARAVPRPLIIGVENVALGVEATPPGERTPLVVGTNLPSGVILPAQPRNLASLCERAGQAQRDPEVAVLVELGAKAYSW